MQYIHAIHTCNTYNLLFLYVVVNSVFCTYNYSIYVQYVIDDWEKLEGFTGAGEAKYEWEGVEYAQ